MPSANFSGSAAYTGILNTNDSGGWNLQARKNSGGGYWTGNPQGWSVSINGQNWSGSWTYDFRQYSILTIAGGSYARPLVDSAFGCSASINMDSGIGNASMSGAFTAQGTASVPQAPTATGWDEITSTSMRFRFSGNGNGGATIDQWQIEYWAEGKSSTHISSPGTSVISGLLPGTVYNARARGHNAVGWGPYSATKSARTLSGAHVGEGTTFRDNLVYVGSGGAFVPATVYVGKGGAYVPAL